LPAPEAGAYKRQVLAVLLAVSLQPAAAAAPPATAPKAASASANSVGSVRLGPDAAGRVLVQADGASVAEVNLRAGETTTLSLPPGDYELVAAQGGQRTAFEVVADREVQPEVPASLRAESVAPPDQSPAVPPSARPDDVTVVSTVDAGDDDGPSELRVTRRRQWRRWGAPVLSAVVPGLGQAVNRQPGRAIAIFTGTVSLALASVALWTSRDPTEGATPGDAGRSDAAEVVRLGGLSAFTGAAGMLYLAQIMDAHAVASGKQVRPAQDHAVSIEVMRSSTVGFSPGEPAYELYTDYSVAVMGQVVRRLTFGLADASVKPGPRRGLTVQAGLRAAYRFFDRGRVWLGAGGGVLMQGTTANGSPAPISAVADTPDTARRFSVVPYAHFETRIFVLDRWSLGLVPRLSVPLFERRFRGTQAIPRYAPTFELGLATGVYF
jgi:hypothetical protein